MLPTWNGFNSLLLECLIERLTEYSRKGHTEGLLEGFRARRDLTGFFAPDFQAQLMEEEIGADYFDVWQSLDTGVCGPVHTALAELAARGRLAAIITTNFDRLIETAFEKQGQPFRVLHDAASFEKLVTALQDKPTPLPIIKIHGSIEDTASLVDTLRQRLAGRPAALNESLQLLLRKHAWLYLGFSGADFSYEPHYLGVLDAAPDAKGFVFLSRPGSKVQPGVQQIAEAYGAIKASIVEGDLSNWLTHAFQLPASAASPPTDDPTAAVKERIRAWVDTLGPMAVVNIVCAMLKSAGAEHAAFWLMRKTWKTYRTTEDTEGKSYWRYQYNYGMSLLDVGLITNPVALADDKSNFWEWKTHADQNAFEFLGRSYMQGKLLTGGAYLASLMAYRGQIGHAIALAYEVSDEAHKKEAWLESFDIAIACSVIYDIAQLFSAPARELIWLIAKAKELGDEPRRALMLAQLGRLLTYTRHFPEADTNLREAERIGRRLDLKKVLVATRAARGLWLADSKTSLTEGVETLKTLADEMRAFDDQALVTKVDLGSPDMKSTALSGRQPLRCRVLMDLTRAAYFADNADLVNSSLDQLDELTVEHFPGYIPEYYLLHAQCLSGQGPPELIADLLRRAREVGRSCGNPSIDGIVDYAQKKLGVSAAAADD
jgi:hypothetical protein